MDFSLYNISDVAFEYFFSLSKKIKNFLTANRRLEDICGIINFFEGQEEYEEFTLYLNKKESQVAEYNKIEYGDFQTNCELANKCCLILRNKNINPEILIEPTCGKGNFILAAINSFTKLKHIYAIEIYKPYIREAKISILNHFLINKKNNPAKIIFFHYNIFDFNFTEIIEKHKNNEFLIIGNPPWVTNSGLSLFDSVNLPPKSNFKNHNGLDAITGKGNFDIGEYITIKLFKDFSFLNCHFGMLLKNIVIKNIINDQQFQKFPVSGFEKYQIDSKKEFATSVNSSFFHCKFNSTIGYTCNEFSLYTPQKCTNQFGWYKNKFSSNISLFKKSNSIDGRCIFEWRQGIKHDCSDIMELEKSENSYINGNSKKLNLESELIYGLLKSSDLNGQIISNPRKYVIVTQKKIGEDTAYIKSKYPILYKYLLDNKYYFNKRKSSIYKGKPEFSIFGVGDYSFKKYKVAISGLYKSTKFSLIIPNGEKTYMLDDTCYFLGFNNKTNAFFTYILLNNVINQKFLESIIFLDSKRAITKEILMRIDFNKLCEKIDPEFIKYETQKYSFLDFKYELWNKYLEKFQLKNNQLQIFKE